MKLEFKPQNMKITRSILTSVLGGILVLIFTCTDADAGILSSNYDGVTYNLSDYVIGNYFNTDVFAFGAKFTVNGQGSYRLTNFILPLMASGNPNPTNYQISIVADLGGKPAGEVIWSTIPSGVTVASNYNFFAAGAVEGGRDYWVLFSPVAPDSGSYEWFFSQPLYVFDSGYTAERYSTNGEALTPWTVIHGGRVRPGFVIKGVPLTLAGSGGLNLKLIASSQASQNVVSRQTSSKEGGTNQITIVRSSITNNIINSSNILHLLENSFNTTFPDGAKLVLADARPLNICVTDSTGTNVVWSPQPTFVLATEAGEQRIHAGVLTTVTTSGRIGIPRSEHDTESLMETMTLIYDDQGLITRDGTHTHFLVNLLVTRKFSADLVRHITRDVVTFDGSGHGTIKDNNVIIRGSGNAAINSRNP